ncbi:MAG: hypothetical protein QXJ06_05580 [Candidatus Aenigmatarchaeota archaeon]
MSKRVIAVGVYLPKLTRDDYLRALEDTELGRRMTNLFQDPEGAYFVTDDNGGVWRVLIRDGKLDIQVYQEPVKKD